MASSQSAAAECRLKIHKSTWEIQTNLQELIGVRIEGISLFGWLVADGWCWFVLR
jgi:hypothetical protein